MKILYILTSKGIGGAQKYVSDLAQHISSNEIETKILYGGEDIKSLSNKSGIFFYKDIKAIFELLKEIKEYKPHILHLNSSKAGVIGALAVFFYRISRERYPRVIFTAHGWVFQPQNKIFFPVKLFYILVHAITNYWIDMIITVSIYDCTIAKKYHIAPSYKLTTIHNGIDYNNLSFLDKVSARKEILHSLHPAPHALDAHIPWIGSIGRLTKEKNYETLITSARTIKNAYFFIIGDGQLHKTLTKKIKTYNLENRFFIISPKGNDARLLKAFDIFTLPSIKEGLPYILLESIAAHIPCVISHAGGMPEVITHKKSGIIIHPKNQKELSEEITSLLTNKTQANKYADRAYESVQKNFSLEEMLKKTKEVYNAML